MGVRSDLSLFFFFFFEEEHEQPFYTDLGIRLK